MFRSSLSTFSLWSRYSIIWPTIFLLVSAWSICSLFGFLFSISIINTLNSFNLVQMHIYNHLHNNDFNVQFLPFDTVFTRLRNLFTNSKKSSGMNSSSGEINNLFALFIQPDYSMCPIIKYEAHRYTAFTCSHFFSSHTKDK